jgi:hypothetical protein
VKGKVTGTATNVWFCIPGDLYVQVGAR